MTKVNEMVNVEFCEICDNYTPSVHIEEAGEYGCQNCYEAYGLELMEFQKGLASSRKAILRHTEKIYTETENRDRE